jgi:hypothetical protein
MLLALSSPHEKALTVFEKTVTRSAHGSIKDIRKWKMNYKYELYALYEGTNIITLKTLAAHDARLKLQRYENRILNQVQGFPPNATLFQ